MLIFITCFFPLFLKKKHEMLTGPNYNTHTHTKEKDRVYLNNYLFFFYSDSLIATTFHLKLKQIVENQ